MIDPDLDPDCNWTGPKGARSIRHITGCKVCSAIWPLIAEAPGEAEIVAMLRRIEREGETSNDGNEP